jgi:hypothetical protein
MGERSTPISDLIEGCLEQQDATTESESFRRFLDAFVGARFGVIVAGRLERVASGQPMVAHEGQASCAMITLPGGASMLVACADKPAYAGRYASRFNAEVDAHTLVTIALANEACKGVMVHSALSDRSVALARDLLPGLLKRCPPPKQPERAIWRRTTSLAGGGRGARRVSRPGAAPSALRGRSRGPAWGRRNSAPGRRRCARRARRRRR